MAALLPVDLVLLVERYWQLLCLARKIEKYTSFCGAALTSVTSGDTDNFSYDWSGCGGPARSPICDRILIAGQGHCGDLPVIGLRYRVCGWLDFASDATV